MHDNAPRPDDGRRVALIKSLATNNRFYALVDPASGIRNADTVERIPEDLVLGIAYPCLEDGLNDFAVIRTTFETLDFFPDDEDMRQELMEIINDARGNLVVRLRELRDGIAGRRTYFLGSDLSEFKTYALDIMFNGCPRRNLDSMMKVNVFMSVAAAEGRTEGSEPPYCYRLRDAARQPALMEMPDRDFVTALFDDVLDSVQDDGNYAGKYSFDRHVFQKYIALMFINYATTDPIFYGTHKSDYGVAHDKDMDTTPLYIAIAHELRRIEKLDGRIPDAGPADYEYEPTDWTRIQEERLAQLPSEIMDHEASLLQPLTALCAAAEQLQRHGERVEDRETAEFARIILANASDLVAVLKRLQIVSPLAYDPGLRDFETE